MLKLFLLCNWKNQAALIERILAEEVQVEAVDEEEEEEEEEEKVPAKAPKPSSHRLVE